MIRSCCFDHGLNMNESCQILLAANACTLWSVIVYSAKFSPHNRMVVSAGVYYSFLLGFAEQSCLCSVRYRRYWHACQCDGRTATVRVKNRSPTDRHACPNTPDPLCLSPLFWLMYMWTMHTAVFSLAWPTRRLSHRSVCPSVSPAVDLPLCSSARPSVCLCLYVAEC